MRYPRIYSLSTVGVLKHYNQGYLLHQVRTDFTGNNGVGKSIIADLFQLIFIPDKRHVVFGTEGLKKEERKIHSLPHSSCSEAYAFLNVEIQKDLFVVIGVCISNNQSKQLKPFFILANADYKKDITEIAIPKKKLVTQNHFIVNDKIPVLEDLAVHLRDKHELYIKYFTYKEDRDEYYSFLFTRKILPINLSIEDNLVAFSKIIQSFSRARSLDVNDSESLKRFLFEDTEKLYEKLFQAHKADLARLMGDYKGMDDYIKELTEKQKRLHSLREKEIIQQNSNRTLLENEVIFLWNELKTAEQQRLKSQNELDALREKVSWLKKRFPKLERLGQILGPLHVKEKNEYTTLIKAKNDFEKYLKIKDDISELQSLQIPELAESQLETIDVSQYGVTVFMQKANEVVSIYKEYGSLQRITNKCEAQQKVIMDRKYQLLKEVESLNEVSKLISLSDLKTLFGRVVNDGKPLTAEQETVLFSFVDVNWSKPSEVAPNSRFTTSLEILKPEQFQTDSNHNGFWFTNGNLSTFYANRKEGQLFAKTKNVQQAMQFKMEEIKEELKQKSSEIEEINKFLKGVIFDKAKIKVSEQLDARIKDFTVLKEIEKGITLLAHTGKKITFLQIEERLLNLKLSELGINLNNAADQSFEEKLKKVELRLGLVEKRERNINELKTREERDLSNYESTTIPLLEQQVNDKAKVSADVNLLYIEKDTYAKRDFPEIIIDLNRTDVLPRKEIADLSKKFNEAKQDYITEYKSLTNYFLFSRNLQNPEIQDQIDKSLYQFTILETVLIGTKIKHMDNISQELQEANQSRLRMADTIHETMLKIFSQTKTKYERYKTIIRNLNTFFKGKKISNRHYFQIKFISQTEFNIEWITKLQSSSQQTYKKGELPFGDTVEHFVEEFFKGVTNYKKRIHLSDLLDPKTYFDLSVSLTDENNRETTGSTGETYSAIVLLGIGRLSIVQEEDRPGVRFIILEETANLDKVNFNTFPNLAEEFGYQIITMTPKPYGSDSDKGWYLHHLFPGIDNADINYPEIASYFKTNENKTDLETYLEAIENELERTNGIK